MLLLFLVLKCCYCFYVKNVVIVFFEKIFNSCKLKCKHVSRHVSERFWSRLLIHSFSFLPTHSMSSYSASIFGWLFVLPTYVSKLWHARSVVINSPLKFNSYMQKRLEFQNLNIHFCGQIRKLFDNFQKWFITFNNLLRSFKHYILNYT